MQEAWQEVMRLARKKVRAVEYRNWLRPLKPVRWNNGTVTVQVKNGEFQTWFVEHYEGMLRETLEEVLKKPTVIEYSIVDPELFDHARPEVTADMKQFPAEFTFDTFIVGSCNHMAYAAGRAVAERPGKAYNPLFIYGGTGLGKTHLLYAIGHAAQVSNPRLRVLYITSETYMNDMFTYLRLKNMEQFRAKYRDACDILLVDDVQFLRGPETQTQFFHTFNALHAANKQIVFTSDRFPEDLPNIEDRLKSRFEWGLIADINAPLLETRVAILKNKAEAMGMALPDDVALLIADQIRDNIRELESSLKTLQLASSTNGTEITVKLAQDTLKAFFRRRVRNVSCEQVQKAVAHKFGLSVAELRSKSRKKTIARPRHIGMYLCRRLTRSSYPEIGEKFGGRDHSSVMSGTRNIERLVKLDSTLRIIVEELEQKFKR